MLEQVVLVFRRGGERRVAGRPRTKWQPHHPGGDVLAGERRLDRRVARIGQGVAIGPGRLLQVERAAVPDAAAIGVREAAAIEELRGEAGRVEAAERHLGVRRIGEAHRRHPAVAPRLADQPGERVRAVLGLA